MAVIDRVRELVLPIVADAQVELYDIEFVGGKLRILVDVADGISIDAIKTISRATSRMLDEVDPIPGRYTLEVSSPGLERPLRTPQHFAAAVSELIKVKTQVEVHGARRFRGTICRADETGFDLAVDGEPRHFRYDDISQARTVFEWGPTPKPGESQNEIAQNEIAQNEIAQNEIAQNRPSKEAQS